LLLILRSDVQGRATRWVAFTFAITGAVWLGLFAAVLTVANYIHVDVPSALAIKLPLLQSHPDLIFAGESRTEYQIDPELAAKLTGRKAGQAVNIAYDAGEPLAFLGAIRQQGESFADAHLVISVAPFLFNEGVRSAAVYPLNVVARLSVFEQLTSFLPFRIGTLIRFIRETFKARLAFEQGVAKGEVHSAAYGLSIIRIGEPRDRWPTDLGTHAHYANWDLSGPKAQYEIGALCEMARLVRKLTVVIPPWAPHYDRNSDELWRKKDDEYAAAMVNAGRRCGFDVLNIQGVSGLGDDNYADEMHVIASGIPIYTSYVVARLRP